MKFISLVLVSSLALVGCAKQAPVKNSQSDAFQQEKQEQFLMFLSMKVFDTCMDQMAEYKGAEAFCFCAARQMVNNSRKAGAFSKEAFVQKIEQIRPNETQIRECAAEAQISGTK